MERAAVLGRQAVVSAADLAFLHATASPAGPIPATDMPGAVEQLERAMIARALADAAGNRSEAARRLGIHRQLLHEKMRRYGIELSENRTPPVGNADEKSLKIL